MEILTRGDRQGGRGIEQNGATAASLVRLRGKSIDVTFDTASGQFGVVVGSFHLESLSAGLELASGQYRGSDLAWRTVAIDNEHCLVEGHVDGVVLTLSFTLHPLHVADSVVDAVTLRAGVSSSSSFTLERMFILEADRLPRPDRLFVEGEPCGTLGTDSPAEFTRAGVMGCTTGKNTLFFTFPVGQSLPCGISGRIDEDGLYALCAACTVGLDNSDETISASALTLCATDLPHAFLEAFGDRQRSPETPAIKPAPVAWNSWDYIVNLVSQDYVLKNLETIVADKVLSRAIDTIVIDDGWQHLYGEWEPNYRFPDGMDGIARRIMDAGYEAGIWFAPAIVENTSTNAYWNDHLLACGRSGIPCCAYECMRRFAHVLDIRKPEARTWLCDLFKRYRDMGYTYFKVDFLRQIMDAELFDGQRVPKGDLVRDVVSAIREAVGKECHILGSNYVAGGVGVIDSNRISNDIAPRFSIVKRNARYIASRFWQHKRLWWNDPDFALCRGPDTSDDPDINRIRVSNIYVSPGELQVPPREPLLSLVEARTLQSIVLLSGGSITLGDNLPVLNETGLDLLRRTVSAETGASARPLDLFTADIPGLWVQKLARGHRVGFINWSDEPDDRSVNVADICGVSYGEAKEFWTDTRVPVSNGHVTVTLAPHETALLELHEA